MHTSRSSHGLGNPNQCASAPYQLFTVACPMLFLLCAIAVSGVANGTNVIITCTPKAVGQAAAAWPEAGFTVQVTATSLSAAGTALPSCSDTKTASRQVLVVKKPTVTLTSTDGAADTPKQVCSNETAVSFTFMASSGASGVDVNITTVAR